MVPWSSRNRQGVKGLEKFPSLRGSIGVKGYALSKSIRVQLFHFDMARRLSFRVSCCTMDAALDSVAWRLLSLHVHIGHDCKVVRHLSRYKVETLYISQVFGTIGPVVHYYALFSFPMIFASCPFPLIQSTSVSIASTPTCACPTRFCSVAHIPHSAASTFFRISPHTGSTSPHVLRSIPSCSHESKHAEWKV